MHIFNLYNIQYLQISSHVAQGASEGGEGILHGISQAEEAALQASSALHACMHACMVSFVRVGVKFMCLDRRRDKYERHVKEFWVDVATEGTLAKSMVEEVSQSFEIVDFDCSLPAPMLGNSPRPDLDQACEESENEENREGATSSDDGEANKPATNGSKAHKSNATSPAKRRPKKSKAKENEIEEALEAWEACSRSPFHSL